ncbi:hypothetical protein BDN72DRAFT_149549 [Pluteus cervinus]|uniref:Uncharacterized protein n=1 Tax=Pluteus cervinus TaxID=181527 RepID=A0ACD3B7A3_9AGAR|nr:hypothetical protein BDN72DRAFT_149549 [Pluteus cervinus]
MPVPPRVVQQLGGDRLPRFVPVLGQEMWICSGFHRELLLHPSLTVRGNQPVRLLASRRLLHHRVGSFRPVLAGIPFAGVVAGCSENAVIPLESEGGRYSGRVLVQDER